MYITRLSPAESRRFGDTVGTAFLVLAGRVLILIGALFVFAQTSVPASFISTIS